MLKALKARNKGFLLLEVLISIVIVASALIVINRAFSVSLTAVKQASNYLYGTFILEDKLFDISIKEAFVNMNISDDIEAASQKFYYVMDVSPSELTKGSVNPEPLGLKKASLSVDWEYFENTGALDVSTYVWEEKEE